MSLPWRIVSLVIKIHETSSYPDIFVRNLATTPQTPLAESPWVWKYIILHNLESPMNIAEHAFRNWPKAIYTHESRAQKKVWFFHIQVGGSTVSDCPMLIFLIYLRNTLHVFSRGYGSSGSPMGLAGPNVGLQLPFPRGKFPLSW